MLDCLEARATRFVPEEGQPGAACVPSRTIRSSSHAPEGHTLARQRVKSRCSL